MKYLFGYNSEDPERELREMRFLAAELPESMQEELDRREEDLARALRKAELPMPLKILEWILLLSGLLCGVGVLKGRVPLSEGYRNAPWAFWIAGIGLAVGGVLWLADRMMRRKAENRETVLAAARTAVEAGRRADDWLGIPDGAEKTDVLVFHYTEKEGRVTLQNFALNSEASVWRQGDELRIAYGNAVFAIPIDSVTGLRLIPGGIPFLGWNKADSPNLEEYKKAGLTLQGGKPFGLKFCCALEWTDADESWQLLFPAYELSKFEKRTGMQGPPLPDGREKPEEGSGEKRSRRDDGRVRPRFYWTIPKGENWSSWFSPLSDMAFRAVHPKLYGLLICIGILLLFLPVCTFLFAALTFLPGSRNSPWLLLGFAGGFATGAGLFNVVAAWMEQYLGHWVTFLCVILGGAMMGASWILMA